MCMRTINSAKTALMAVTYTSNFFDDYGVEGPDVLRPGTLLKVSNRFL